MLVTAPPSRIDDENVDPADRSRRRAAAFAMIVVALGAAVWFQRGTVMGALVEIRALPLWTLVVLAVLTVYERASRAAIVRRLLGEPVGFGDALVVHDVGTAVSKGIPFGGPLGTALRWSLCQRHGVGAPRFVVMLVAYGIATTFVSWMLPLGAVLADLTQRAPNRTDAALVMVTTAVLVASATFWFTVLRSERLERWAARRVERLWGRLADRVASIDRGDAAGAVVAIRRDLHLIGRRPGALLARTALAQACGAVILLVALRGLGVGAELGTTEFFRVFFVVHLLGTFAPTPGGVGVVEAGATGALVAAGVDASSALAGVLVYRLLTYVTPIALGAALYAWRRPGRVRHEPRGSVTLTGHGASFDTAVPDLPRVEDQGLRRGGHARRDDRVAR